MFENIIKVLNNRFGEKIANATSDSFPLMIIDQPESRLIANRLIEKSVPKKIATEIKRGLNDCENMTRGYINQGESTAFFIPMVYEVDGVIVYKGVIIKPHLQELITAWTSGAITKCFAYMNMGKVFAFLINLFSNLDYIERIDNDEINKISEELVLELLTVDKELKIKSKSIIQDLGFIEKKDFGSGSFSR